MRNNVVLDITSEDIEELFIILKNSFNKNLEFDKFKRLYGLSKEDKNTKILGYYKNNIVIGTLLYNVVVMPNGKEMTIWNVAVKEEFRNQGIATKLMNEAEKIARADKDITRIWLFSGKHREIAHKLYRKLGYDEDRDKAFIKSINEKGK